jgi:hypothetical protein
LHEAVDLLPKEADEGTVVPAATFTPADNYKHTTSHKAVLALYELIGGCLANNTEPDMEPLFAMAAQEAETAAFTAAAANGNKKALQQFMQQQQQQAGQGSGSSAQQQQRQGEGATASGADEPRPAAAWFPSAGAGDQPAESAVSGGSSSKAGSGGGAASSGQQQQQQEPKQPQEPKQQQSQLQQVQGLASIQWYDARARVAVKRVAHW